ncbi:MAG: hypothetical protein KDN05_02125 [Verrucomicrobiae bacterium]|nr:hypothetical protein [Verrucomicrobiae bacterium]
MSILLLASAAADTIPASLERMKRSVVETETETTRRWLAGDPDMELPEGADTGQLDILATVTRPALDRLLALLDKDGRFGDIDYTSTNRGRWKVVRHLHRVRMLAIAARTYPEKDQPAIHGAFHRALGWWVTTRPRNENWWYGEIAIPRYLGVTAILMEDELRSDEREFIAGAMKPATISRTGQNRLWLSVNVALRGLIEGDEALVAQAVSEAFGTADVTTGDEGIQPDFSFRQHGAQFYQGNYGHHYLLNIAYLMRLVEGGPYAADSKAKATIGRLALDGTRWMMCGELLDHAAVGRQISYPNRIQGPPLASVCDALVAVNSGDADALVQWSRSIRTNRPAPEPQGTRHFWRSDFAINRGMNWMASVKMCSERTLSTETTNEENLKGAYLCEGMTLLYRNGQEYRDIFAVWDWNLLPGVTSRSTAPLPPASEWAGIPGSGRFVGGVSGDQIGLVAMEARRFGVRADKLWFNDGGGLWAWTENISSDGGGNIVTTVNQCLSRGPVLRRESAGGTAIWHNGWAYLFPRPDCEPSVGQAKKSGRWSEIAAGETNTPDERDVFLLRVDHGEHPSGASLLYRVQPMERNEFERAAFEGMASAVSGSAGVRAIETADRAGVVFHQAGSIDLAGFGRIQSDGPCLLTLLRNQHQVGLSLCDPTQSRTDLTLRVGGRIHRIELPRDGMAGSTVHIKN